MQACSVSWLQVFHEIPTPLSVLGALVICLGTLTVILSETWLSRKQQWLGNANAAAGAAAALNVPDEERFSLLQRRSLELPSRNAGVLKTKPMRDDTKIHDAANGGN